MYDSSNFLVGFGSKNLDMTENHKMVGFLLHRDAVDAVDADLDAVTQVIDLRRSVNGCNNTIMIAARRTAGAGAFAAELYAILPSDQPAGVLPFPVFTHAVDQPGETGLVTLDDLPAAQYKLKITGVGASTWQVYVAYSANFVAPSG